MKKLSTPQLMRYSRHIMLKEMDIDGQEKLWNSRVLLIGVGGLGCSVAQYLAASGIGELTLVDDDCVDMTNLQRQVLHHEANIGINKCLSAKASLSAINSEIHINIEDKKLVGQSLDNAIASHDIVIDCSDNLATRNELNLACYRAKKPLVSGAAIRMEGQIAVYDMQPSSPCYQCLSQHFGEQVLTCSEAGVLSPLVGIVGSIQACETIKVLTGIGQPLIGKLMLFDASDMAVNTYTIPKSIHCSVCSPSD
ncbi:molybdopterin-synthase adenylyltransferase MoeB [Thalassotalea piscium]